MNYCSKCGSTVDVTVPPGDSRARHVCTACGFIHYQNPRMIVGTVPEWDGRVLLCRRAIHPRKNLWTLPAGFLENGESADQGAARETWEEARTRVEIVAPYTLLSVPHVDQVHLYYRARMQAAEYSAGEESLEVELFNLEHIPWQELAFSTVRETLRHYCVDRDKGRWGLYSDTIVRQGGRERRLRET